MPIQYADRGDGFILWPDAIHTPSLGIESDRLLACIAEVKRRGFKGVFGTVPYFREQTLDFLTDLPHLEAAEFWDVLLRSVSGLYALTELRCLRLTERRPPLDFGRLRSLRTLVWNHVPKDAGSGSLQEPEELYLWRYKHPSRNFENLELPPSLTALSIFWSNARTLDGLPNLPKLTRLEVGRCRNLESLGSLAGVCPNLETLLVSASGRIRIDEAKRVASRLPRLRHLVAEDKLLIDPNAT